VTANPSTSLSTFHSLIRSLFAENQETPEQETMESQSQYLVTNRTLFKIDKRLGPEEALSSDELPRQVNDDFVDTAWMGSRLRAR
jgi:hypothetical protein